MRLPGALRALCLLTLLSFALAAVSQAQTRPGTAPATGPMPAPRPAAADPVAELQRLRDEVTRLDPKSPEFPARVKAILLEMLRLEQAMAGENAALRAQLAAPAPAAGKAQPGAGRSAAKSAPAGAATGPVVLFGKRGLKKYHRTGCSAGERIDAAQRITFADPAAAAAAGYEPCRICRPDAAPIAPATAPPAAGSKP